MTLGHSMTRGQKPARTGDRTLMYVNASACVELGPMHSTNLTPSGHLERAYQLGHRLVTMLPQTVD